MADIARRREAYLTSGVVTWNKLPASFKRVHSAKRSSNDPASSHQIPRHPTPKLQLQPNKTVPSHAASSKVHQDSRETKKKSIIVTLPSDSGAVRPKSANFPARNFLAGYRQIQHRSFIRRELVDDDSDRMSQSSSILMLSPSHEHPGVRQDLDQMDDEELNQIFEELTAGDDDEIENRKTQKKKDKALKTRFGVHPEATNVIGKTNTPSEELPNDPEDLQPHISSHFSEIQPEGYNGVRSTPTSFRTMSAFRNPANSRISDAGQLVCSDDNLVYVPRPKTRLCRVYVGSTVVKPTNHGRPLEFLPVNRQANLHSRNEMRSRPTSGKAERPIQYSTNFSSSYDLKHGIGYGYPFTHPSTPEPNCIMCQHYLQQ